MKASLITPLLQGDPARWCTEIAQQHGGMAKLPLPGQRAFWVVSNPIAVRTVLTSKAFDKGGPFYQTIARALGDGLFTTNDPALWQRLHDTMWPSLRRHQPAAGHVGALATSQWQRRMQTWQLQRPVELFTELKEFSIELLATYLFGAEVDSAKLARLARLVFAGMAGRVFLPSRFPGGNRYARNVEALMAEIDTIVARRRTQPSQNTLLDALLQANPAFTPSQLRDQVMTMLMAGHDSTATVLAWALIRLSERPNLYHEVRQAALASSASTPPEVARVIRAASHEHPAFPMFPRNVACDTELMGHQLHAKDQLVVSIHGVHHTPGLWAGFDHFLQADSAGLTPEQRNAHAPFGAGKRKCPGEDFALYTGGIALTLFLREFSAIHRPNQNSGDRSRYAMTRSPRDNAAMYLRR